MNDIIKILIWSVIAVVIFAVLLRKGYFLRISNYIAETREELRKCTWPSVEELKGSTVVVMITIALLGGFTVGVDFVLSMFLRLIT